MKEIIRERFRVKHPAGMFYRVTNTKGAARESGRVRFPSKISRFSHPFLRAPKARRRDFAVFGQRPGLLALALASIFEKIAGAKNFIDAITCGFRVINSFCQKMCSDRFAVKEGVQL